jgi:hypothetical protein
MSNDKTFLTDLGISRQQSSDWQKLAEVPTDITCRAWHQKLTFSPPEANFSRLSSPKMANSQLAANQRCGKNVRALRGR